MNRAADRPPVSPGPTLPGPEQAHGDRWLFAAQKPDQAATSRAVYVADPPAILPAPQLEPHDSARTPILENGADLRPLTIGGHLNRLHHEVAGIWILGVEQRIEIQPAD